MTKKFGLELKGPVNNPMRSTQQTVERKNISDTEWEATKKKYPNFQRLLQSINYALITRGDNKYMYNFWSRRQQRYDADDWFGLVHGQLHLETTAKKKLTMRRSKIEKQDILKVYADASFADDGTRRSTIGLVVMFLNNTAYVQAKRLGSMSSSTGEAELQAASSAGKEIVHYRNLANILGWNINDTRTILYCDASSAIRMAYAMPGSSKLTRHIEVCWFLIRELVLVRKIDVRFCPTIMMLADGQTKIQTTQSHTLFSEAILDNVASKLRRLHQDFITNFGPRYFGISLKQ